MKKNININLFGTIYAIDEDAYELMESYLQNIKDYFSKREGGEEVADDIEHRFAELLWEKKQQGVEAIDIMTVKEIIKKIGNPEELDESAADEKSASADDNQDAHKDSGTSDAGNNDSSAECSSGPRKFYRDGKDKLVGGVMSGLAHYTGGSDPFPWRIALVILFIIIPKSGWIAVLYLIAWMLFPEAKTAEERLRMMGKPVTADNIGDEVMNENKPQPQQSGARGCLGSMLGVVAVLFKAMLYVTVGFFGFILIIVLFSICVTMFALPLGLVGDMISGLSSPDDALQAVQLMSFVQGSKSILILLGSLLVVLVFLPIYALIHVLANREKKLSMMTKFCLIFLWFAALCGSALCSYKLITRMDEQNVQLSSFSGLFDDFDSDRTVKVYDDLEMFNELDLNCVAGIEYTQGDTCKVVVKGKPGTLDKIGVVSQNGILQIWNQEDISGKDGKMKIRITSPDLNRVSMDGVGAFEAEDGIITPGVLTLEQKGVGALDVKAKCRTLIYNGKGVGAAGIKVDVDSLIVNSEGIGVVELSGKTGFLQKKGDGIGKIDTEELVVNPK